MALATLALKNSVNAGMFFTSFSITRYQTVSLKLGEIDGKPEILCENMYYMYRV